MTESGRSPWRWLGYGCLGCVGIILLLILVGGGFTGVAWFQARNEKVEDQVLVREVEPVAVAEASREETIADVDPEAAVATSPAVGKVSLRLHQAEVEVRPGESGEPIRVKANYDTNSHTLEESYEPGAGDDPWSYTVNFESSGSSSIIGILKRVFGTQPRVTVLLPPDVPIELDLDIHQGGGVVELGGLWLTSATVKSMQGGGAFLISEPLREPMETLDVEWSMGGGALVGVANASPRRFDFRSSMGGGEVDLRGTWLRDADIRMEFEMGGGAVRLPEGAIIRGLDGFGIEAPGSVELPKPVLTFEVFADPDDVQFRR
jgi:hypothetical protein